MSPTGWGQHQGAIDKGFTAQIFGAGLISAEIEGCVEAQPREGETEEIGLSAMTARRRAGTSTKGQRGLVSGVVFDRFQTCRSGAGYRGPLPRDRAVVLLRDEQPKPQPSPYEYSPIMRPQTLDVTKMAQDIAGCPTL
jgi:hypothetical protein